MNLDDFLKEILNYNNDQLSRLLGIYEDEIEFEDMMYIIAVEDYNVFHDFMHEACVAISKGQQILGYTKRRRDEAQGQPQQQQVPKNFNKPITEEDLIAQAIAESMKGQPSSGAT